MALFGLGFLNDIEGLGKKDPTVAAAKKAAKATAKAAKKEAKATAKAAKQAAKLAKYATSTTATTATTDTTGTTDTTTTTTALTAADYKAQLAAMKQQAKLAKAQAKADAAAAKQKAKLDAAAAKAAAKLAKQQAKYGGGGGTLPTLPQSTAITTNVTPVGPDDSTTTEQIPVDTTVYDTTGQQIVDTSQQIVDPYQYQQQVVDPYQYQQQAINPYQQQAQSSQYDYSSVPQEAVQLMQQDYTEQATPASYEVVSQDESQYFDDQAIESQDETMDITPEQDQTTGARPEIIIKPTVYIQSQSGEPMPKTSLPTVTTDVEFQSEEGVSISDEDRISPDYEAETLDTDIVDEEYALQKMYGDDTSGVPLADETEYDFDEGDSGSLYGLGGLNESVKSAVLRGLGALGETKVDYTENGIFFVKDDGSRVSLANMVKNSVAAIKGEEVPQTITPIIPPKQQTNWTAIALGAGIAAIVGYVFVKSMSKRTAKKA